MRVPADVDMADRIFAGLTARQLAILGAHGLLLLALYAVLGQRKALVAHGTQSVPRWAICRASGRAPSASNRSAETSE